MPVVVERTFRIRPGTFAEFEQISRERIWPYFHARGCRIVGLFQQMHGGPANEIVLLTAYDSLAHWESTRAGVPPPDGSPPETVELARTAAAAVRERQQLVEATWSRVLRLATEWVDLGVEAK